MDNPGGKQRFLLITFIALALLIASLWIFITGFLAPFVGNYAGQRLGEGATINISKAGYLPFSKTFFINGFNVSVKDDNDQAQRIAASSIRLEGIELFKLLREGRLLAKHLEVADPNFDLIWTRDTLNTTSDDFTLPEPVTSLLDNSRLESGAIRNARIKLEGKSEQGDFFQNNMVDVVFRGASIKSGKRSIESFEVIVRDYQLLLPDGRHQLFAAEARINSVEKYIAGRDIRLIPTAEALMMGLGRYELLFPEIRLKTDIIANLNNPYLIIDSVWIRRPSVKIFSEEVSPLSSAGKSDNSNPYDLIRGLFDFLEIGHVTFENGRMDFMRYASEQEGRINARNVNITFDGFLLDSSSAYNPSRIILSQSVRGEISNLYVELNDSVHVLNTQQLVLSSTEKIFRARSVEVSPGKVTPTRLMADNQPFFNLFLPELDLSGADLSDMFNGRFFRSEILRIQRPQLQLNFTSMKQKNESGQSELDIYPYLSDFFSYVEVEEVVVDDGRLLVTNLKDGGRDTLSIGRLDLSLFGVQIDSLTAQKTQNKIFYASDILLDLEGYSLRLADGIHTLSSDRLLLSSADSLIKVTNVRLRPTAPQNAANRQKYSLFDLQVPDFTIEGVTIKEAFYDEKIKVRKALAVGPSLRTSSFNFLASTRDPEDRNPVLGVEGIEELLADYFTDIDIAELRIVNGFLASQLSLPEERRWHTEGALDASMQGLQFASMIKGGEGLTSDNVDFSIRDFILELPDEVHILKAKNIDFDWQEARLRVRDLQIDADEKKGNLTKAFVEIDSLILNRYSPGKETFFVRETGPLELFGPRVRLQIREGYKIKTDDQDDESPILAPIISVSGWLVQNGSLEIECFSADSSSPQSVLKTRVEWVGDTVQVLGSEKDYARKGIANTIFVQFRDLSFLVDTELGPTLSLEALNFRQSEKRLEARGLNVDQWAKGGNATAFSAFFPGIILDNFSPEIAYVERHIGANALRLNAPEIAVRAYELSERRENESQKFALPEGINSMAIQNLLINEGILSWISKPSDTLKIAGISGQLERIRYENQALDLFSEGDFDLEFSGLSFILPDSLYRLSTGPIKLDKDSTRIEIGSLSMTPLLSKGYFYERIGFSEDYLNIQSGPIILHGIDPVRFLQEKALIAQKVDLYNLHIEDFRDRNYPDRESDKKPMPMEAFLQLDQTIHVDELFVHDGFVSYTELPLSGSVPGTITFDRIQARLSNLSNHADSIGKGYPTALSANARLMNSGNLLINYQTSALDPEFRFQMRGRLGIMPLTAFNPILKPVTFVEVTSGELRSMEFNFQADMFSSSGALRMDYRKLRVAIYDPESANLERERAFMSFLANTFVIRNRSSRIIGQPRPQPIEHERDPEKSIFNYWWKSILSGVKPSLGLKN
jgi:hypothetical protein